MYVAELDGRVVATGIINKTQVNVYLECDWEYKAPEDRICVLHTLAVDPDVRGMKTGSLANSYSLVLYYAGGDADYLLAVFGAPR